MTTPTTGSSTAISRIPATPASPSPIAIETGV
jgi:hypothetical protein